MFRKTIFFLLLISLLALLAACNTGGAEPAADSGDAVVSTDSDAETVASDTPTAGCDEAAPGAHLLVDAAHGICFHYPDNYDVFQGGDSGYTLYVRSPLNTEAPLASLSFEPANGRSLEEVAAQRLTDYAFPDMESQPATLAGEPAAMLDNLPGQDTNRRLVAVHDDTVIDLMVARIGADYGEIGEQAQALYEMISGSLRTIPVVAGASLHAGPECPEAEEGVVLYTNAEDGFCLLLPEGYEVDDSLTTEHGTETAVYVNSLLDVSHPRLYITVEEANGRSLNDVTEAIQDAFAGFDVMGGSFGHMLDGEPAMQFEQLPGQDLNRQVAALHNGRLYTLTFVPDDPEAGEIYSEMQTLYDLVMDSFSFTWQD